MRRSFLLGLAPCLAAAAILFSTQEAKAGVTIDLDLDLGTAFLNAPVGANVTKLSYGFDGRLGYRLGFGRRSPVWVQPELGAGYMILGTVNNATGASVASFHATRIFGGARLGFGRVVQPNLFAHLGVGFAGQAVGNGPAFDIGAAIDFRIVRQFALGVHAAYNHLVLQPQNGFDPGTDYKWIALGIHGGVHF